MSIGYSSPDGNVDLGATSRLAKMDLIRPLFSYVKPPKSSLVDEPLCAPSFLFDPRRGEDERQTTLFAQPSDFA